uniref:Ig-like domain-containing protein n=1 Tax=Leptobrachium leishanense TaxID=445787 RepID=A0A8C5P9N0_9ANUR
MHFKVLTVIIIASSVSGNLVIQKDSEFAVRGGQDITLGCKYTETKYVLIWYLQKPHGSLQLVLHDESKKLDEVFMGRFSAHHDPEQKTFDLSIKRSQWTDTGTYYCALEYVGAKYSRSLVFGSGTKLTVEPGDGDPSPPSVFVLKSQAKSTAACLAKDFYPKDVEIYLNSSKQSIGPVEAKSILSKKGKYSAVQVGELGAEDVHCQAKHQGQWVTERDVIPNTQVVSEKNDDEGNSEHKKRDPQTAGPPEQSNIRVNLQTLTIFGMRILFAKTVAFNLLLSAKIFIM